MRLAWVYRKESPLIMIRTEDDPAKPIVEVISRREWEMTATTGGHTGVPVAVFYDRECFNPDESFFYMCALRHQGFQHDKTTGMLIEDMFQPGIFIESLIYALTMEEARSFNAVIEEDASTVTDQAEILQMFRQIRDSNARDFAMKRMGQRVRLAHLRNAAHLNGKEALMVRRDPNNIFARVIVRFDDGAEVSIGQGFFA
jgi:hypothetical protein